jgi:hypothetical protein
MTYQRIFTRQQVHELIYQSESRESPTSGAPGHTLALHGDMRTDVADQRVGRIIHLAETIEKSRGMDPALGISAFANYVPGVDGRFTSRLDLLLGLHEALNSRTGQNALREFDANPGKKRVSFTAPLASPVGDVERYVKATGRVERGLRAYAIFVILDRLSGPPECGLHLQTAYPQDLR